MDSLQSFLDGGGTLAEARRKLDDLGLMVENAIEFARWIVDDEATRKQSIESTKLGISSKSDALLETGATPSITGQQNTLNPL